LSYRKNKTEGNSEQCPKFKYATHIFERKSVITPKSRSVSSIFTIDFGRILTSGENNDLNHFCHYRHDGGNLKIFPVLCLFAPKVQKGIVKGLTIDEISGTDYIRLKKHNMSSKIGLLFLKGESVMII
jgi:hypothetical protein